MVSDSGRGPWIKALLVFAGIFILVLIVRYLVLKDLDFGFSLVIAVLVVFIYFLAQRLTRYVRSKEI
jgi:cell division protein FtsW (lipid II flippase)